MKALERKSLVTAVYVALVQLSCSGGGDSITAPPPPPTKVPTAMAAASTTSLTGVAGEAVSPLPAVTITDQNHAPLAGVGVTFAVTAGAGTITGAAVTTDANGVATLGGWTLGKTVGQNVVTASSGQLTPVTFTATATPGAAATIVKTAGDAQSIAAGGSLPTPPTVAVTDANSNPIAGISVTFSVASGGGSVTGATVATNASGLAAVGSWTLGKTAGPNSLSVTVGQLTPVIFTAQGLTGAPALIVKTAGDGQTAVAGSSVAVPPSVTVTDANGNVIAGASVTFVIGGGEGTISGATATTNANGVAAVGSWTLGKKAGVNGLVASIGQAQPVTFIATGIAGPPVSISKTSGDGQTAVAGSAVATAPAVTVSDANGNAAAGAHVNFNVTGGGGTVTQSSATTDASGVATPGSWVLGTKAGPNQLAASVTGAGSVTFAANGVAGPPAIITKIRGDNQTYTGGQQVPIDPTIRVTDVNDNPTSGVQVTWTTGPSAPTNTNADGIASTSYWYLGAQGQNTLDAVVSSSVKTTFTATATDPCTTRGVYVFGSTIDANLDYWDCHIFGDPYDSFEEFRRAETTETAWKSFRITAFSNFFSPHLALMAPDSAPISPDPDTALHGSSMHIIGPVPTAYTIAVSGLTDKYGGGYKLSSELAPEGVTNCDRTYLMRGALTHQQLEATDCASGSYDQFVLYVPKYTTNVTIDMSSSDFTTHLQILTMSGGVIATADGNGSIVVPYLDRNYYLIRAGSTSAGQTGAYTLGVHW